MDTALVVITLLSVGLTGALLVYASKLQREQREREDARVVALAQEIRVDAAPVSSSVFRHDVAHATGTSTVPIAHEREQLSLQEPQPAVTMPEVDTAPARVGLFSVDTAPGHPSRRLAIPAMGAAIVGLVIGGVYFVSARPGAASRPAAPAASALELVSLEQARTGQALTVRGDRPQPSRRGTAQWRGRGGLRVRSVGRVRDELTGRRSTTRCSRPATSRRSASPCPNAADGRSVSRELPDRS